VGNRDQRPSHLFEFIESTRKDALMTTLRKPPLLYLALFLSFAPGTRTAHAADPPCPQCGTVTDPKVAVVTIDARTGEVQGKKRFAKKDTVKVVLANKNPYLFKYQVTKTETAVDEKVLQSFVTSLSPLLSGQFGTPAPTGAPGATGATGATGTTPLSALAVPVCPTQPEALALRKKIEDLEESIQKTEVELGNLGQETQSVETTLTTRVDNDRTGLTNAQADCQRLCTLTHDVKDDKVFMSFPSQDAASINKKLDQLGTDIDTLRQSITTYVVRFRPGASCPFPAAALQAADTAAAKRKEGIAMVQKRVALEPKVKPWQASIQAVAADPTAFTAALTVGDYDQTTDVVVKVTRQGLGKDDKPTDLASVTLRFGAGPFFSLTGGIAYSHITKPQFAPTQGFPRNRDGSLVQPADTPARVIGTSESANPVTPILMLNGRIKQLQWQDVGLHLSLGITAKNTDNSTDIEYLVGLSVSGLDDRLFLTVGTYGWKRQALQGDQFVGQKIDTSVTTLATTKQSHWKLGFALTYRVR
jgi:hypothetical protein